MSNKEVTIDMRGQVCPAPVIEAKKAMDSDANLYVKVIVDNDVSRDNVVKLGEYRGYENHVLEQEGNYIVVFVTTFPKGAANSFSKISSKSRSSKSFDV